ncbi:MFS transporter [Micrococcus luteus]|uniref:MFS transporter n=1 Tax=Micrococcus luteus TaxID=1270 RepID=UPI00387A5EB9
MTGPAALGGHQRRVVRTLAASQVFSGLGNGSALAVGSVLAVELTGDTALGGTTTMLISAAGALTALPLARLALTRGRRTALTTAYAVAALGAACMLPAPALGSFALLLVGAFGVGLGAAGNLQARFAATDLSAPGRRGRDLGLVVWSITVGAVAGPNLIGPGAVVARWLGLPETAGVFLFSLAGMLVAVAVLQAGLRPDPLALRRDVGLGDVAAPEAPRLRAGLRAVVGDPRILVGVVAVVTAHAVMVGVMAMTPVHLTDAHGGGHRGPDTLVVIGAVISLHIAGMYALSPVMGWAADRWGRLRVTAAGFAVLLASSAVGGLGAGSTLAVAVALVLLGLGWSAVTVAGSAWVSEVATGPRRVLVQGVTDTGMGAAAAATAGLSGLVLAGAGFAGLNVAAGALAAALLVWVLRARDRYEITHDSRYISDNVTS